MLKDKKIIVSKFVPKTFNTISWPEKIDSQKDVQNRGCNPKSSNNTCQSEKNIPIGNYSKFYKTLSYDKNIYYQNDLSPEYSNHELQTSNYHDSYYYYDSLTNKYFIDPTQKQIYDKRSQNSEIYKDYVDNSYYNYYDLPYYYTEISKYDYQTQPVSNSSSSQNSWDQNQSNDYNIDQFFIEDSKENKMDAVGSSHSIY